MRKIKLSFAQKTLYRNEKLGDPREKYIYIQRFYFKINSFSLQNFRQKQNISLRKYEIYIHFKTIDPFYSQLVAKNSHTQEIRKFGWNVELKEVSGGKENSMLEWYQGNQLKVSFSFCIIKYSIVNFCLFHQESSSFIHGVI